MAVYLHNELCRYDNSDDDNDNIEQVIGNSDDDNDYFEQVIDNSDDEENDNIEEVIDSCDGHVCCLSKPSIEFLLRPIKTMLTISLDLSTLFGFGQSGSNNPNITSIVSFWTTLGQVRKLYTSAVRVTRKILQ